MSVYEPPQAMLAAEVMNEVNAEVSLQPPNEGDRLENILGLAMSNNSSIGEDAVDCMGMPDQASHWSIVCESVLSVIVGICGLLGNTATVAVLSRPQFKETFHKLLIGLSCVDSVFIVSALLIYTRRAYGLFQVGPFLEITFAILYLLGNVALYASIYITLGVSIERFLGVVYPMQSRTRPRRNLWAYLLPVLVLAVGFNVPKALEFRITIVNGTIEVGTSDLAMDPTYTKYYKVWSNLIVTTIVPILVLIVCNGSIFIQLRKSRKEMLASRQSSNNSHTTQPTLTVQNSSAGGGLYAPPPAGTIPGAANGSINSTATTPIHVGNHNHRCHSPDYNLAMILAGIVIVFAVCHSFRFFLAFYHVSIVEKTSLCMEEGQKDVIQSWMYVISALNHLMLLVNSSVNFIIYCAVGSRFRQALTASLICFKRRPRGSLGGRTEAGILGNNEGENDHLVLTTQGHATGHHLLSAVVLKNDDHDNKDVNNRSSNLDDFEATEMTYLNGRDSSIRSSTGISPPPILTLTRLYNGGSIVRKQSKVRTTVPTCSSKMTDL